MVRRQAICELLSPALLQYPGWKFFVVADDIHLRTSDGVERLLLSSADIDAMQYKPELRHRLMIAAGRSEEVAEQLLLANRILRSQNSKFREICLDWCLRQIQSRPDYEPGKLMDAVKQAEAYVQRVIDTPLD